VLYDDLATRVAVPEGVAVVGDGLVSLGQEPRTQASIYDLSASSTFALKISGQGQLARSGGGPEAAAPPAGSEIRIADAPVAKEMYWVIGLTAAVLLVGFFYLFTAKQPDPAMAGAGPAEATETPPRSAAPEQARSQPRPRKA
jgi:hypothetical protein